MSTAITTTTAADLRQRLRVPLRIALVLLLIALITTLVKGTSSSNALDPSSPSPDGARAIASLLADQGSAVTRVPEPPAEGSNTVVFATPWLLPENDVTSALDLARTTDVVVLVGTSYVADWLGVKASAHSSDRHPAQCSLAAAQVAGAVSGIGFTLSGTPDGFSRTDNCYGHRVQRFTPDSGSGSLVLVGGSRWLTNDQLDDNGNAALALNLTGGRTHIEWVRPLPGEITLGSSNENYGLSTVLPDGTTTFLLQLGAGLLVLALVVGRRLGPVVSERLPVPVHGTETSKGRARLWSGAHSYDRAALALREHARAQLARTLGLGPSTSAEHLSAATAQHHGYPQQTVQELLYGTPPASDADFVRLADDLDRLIAQNPRGAS